MSDIWKRKLAAYLHDPPSKCLDIYRHEDRSETAFRQAGFTDEEINRFIKSADHIAAAADRLPFPRAQASGLICAFDGVRNCFHHPLSGHQLSFHAEFKSTEQAFDGESSVQPKINDFGDLPEDECWRARYFAHWRLWPAHAAGKDYRFAFLPADTRIPDHTIWNHMQIVSALAGCAEGDGHPAFIKFQLGPVQDFIAAARSIRDLWSGSYLLSWLMAAGLKALSAEVGPDSVVFPNLRGQPLFDLHWRKDLWNKVKIGNKSVWNSLGYDSDSGSIDLLTPSLPNVFLAVIPADRGEQLGQLVEKAIRREWQSIAEAVWNECEKAGLTKDESDIKETDRKVRYFAQIDRLLSLSWQVTEWPSTLAEALHLADVFSEGMSAKEARQRVQTVVDMATKQMPKEHRDSRYYIGGKDGPKTELNNIGLGWSVILAVNGWQLDAVRRTRTFTAWKSGGWEKGTHFEKDALNGRDEAVAGGKIWVKKAKDLGGFWESLFKHEDWIGASTLVKRFWHLAYLKNCWGLNTGSEKFPMPDTSGIAAHDPFGNETQRDADSDNSEKYFAVLAFDGDKIGKWMSGERTPLFSSQLAAYSDGSNIQQFGSKAYFERPEFDHFLDKQRPLSPSYHLQFSEALSNFALFCARPLVEAFDGRLIYAGGDDVLAILPADTALSCASALRLAFTGTTNLSEYLKEQTKKLVKQSPQSSLKVQTMAVKGQLLAVANNTHGGTTLNHPGFLTRLDDCCESPEKRRFTDTDGRPIPFVVPGPKADCSVGIAIAHFKAPLQDVVRAAQAAEKRAKNKLGRSAVAVTLFKRSGEIIEWGCKWEDGGLDLYQAIADSLLSDDLSNKCPHRVVELLDPYLTQQTPLMVCKTQDLDCTFDKVIDEIIGREIGIVCDRQRGPKWKKEVINQIKLPLEKYLTELEKRQDDQQEKRLAKMSHSERKLRAVIGLCQTVAFAHRTRPESANQTTSNTAH